MAVYAYGLTHSNITPEIPGAAGSTFSTTSIPVTTTQITVWITEAAGVVTSLLNKAGISPDATWLAANEEAAEVAKSAVKAYVVERIAAVMGMDALYTRAKERWDEAHARLSTFPEVLGDAYDDGYTVAVDDIADEAAEPWDFNVTNGQVW